MKSKITITLWLLCSMLISTGCEMSKTPKENLKNSGLFGEHKLLKIERVHSGQNTESGNFLFGTGKLESGSQIAFYWSPTINEIISTELPIKKCHFIINDKADKPTVEFIFEDYWLDNSLYSASPEQHLNDFLLSDHLKLAKIKISRDELKKLLSLPAA